MGLIHRSTWRVKCVSVRMPRLIEGIIMSTTSIPLAIQATRLFMPAKAIISRLKDESMAAYKTLNLQILASKPKHPLQCCLSNIKKPGYGLGSHIHASIAIDVDSQHMTWMLWAWLFQKSPLTTDLTREGGGGLEMNPINKSYEQGLNLSGS